MCRATRIQGVRPNDMGGRIPAFVVDSIATPSEDHKALLQQMESGRREMMVKLEDMDRKMLRREVHTLPLQEQRAVARRPVSEGSGAENLPETNSGKEGAFGLEGVLKNLASEIRREVEKTNEDFHINPIYPATKRR